MESWVTLATNDSYCVGALVLAVSLRRANTSRNLAILVTNDITLNMLDNLHKAFNDVVTVEPLDSGDESNLKLLARVELGVTLTKLHCWTLTKFAKCVFLDADTLVVANCDDLFDREEFSAAPDAGWPDCFNSGVFVFRPNMDTFKSILHFAADHGSFDGGDQGLLNHYFSSWATKDISKHLPFLYNMCATSTYTYLPAYKHYGGGVKIVHFIGSTKPWNIEPSRPHNQFQNTEHLCLWWNIFEADVKMTFTAGSAMGEGGQELSVDRREQWEHGRPDYGGTAAFENIIKKIGDTLNVSQPEHLCVLVYLITVMHSMQAGYMDKAQKYTDKAVVQIQKLRQHEESPLLSVFHVLLIEHIIQCRLVVGNNVGAIQEIGNICRLLDKNPVLMASHRAQLHTLLGLYSMSKNQMDQAENQLNAALRTSTERELWTFANLNLAIVYLRSRRDQDFMALLDRIHPDRLPSQSHSLKAAAFYIQGLQSFFAAQYNESKRYLRETLKMANAEDLNRLTSCSLMLLGHIFLSLGNTRESMNMVTPAMQLASKIPDVNVQLWASAILKDLYRMQDDPVGEAEGSSMHANFTNSIAKDSFQACQELEHQLINWTDGPFPTLTPASNNAQPY